MDAQTQIVLPNDTYISEASQFRESLAHAVLLYYSATSDSPLELEIQKIYEIELRCLSLSLKEQVYLALRYIAKKQNVLNPQEREFFDIYSGAATYFKRNFVFIKGGNAYWRPDENEVVFDRCSAIVIGNEKAA